jgi:predicted PolB exonuclease-like 3'-5' exonuclease
MQRLHIIATILCANVQVVDRTITKVTCVREYDNTVQRKMTTIIIEKAQSAKEKKCSSFTSFWLQSLVTISYATGNQKLSAVP